MSSIISILLKIMSPRKLMFCAFFVDSTKKKSSSLPALSRKSQFFVFFFRVWILNTIMAMLTKIVDCGKCNWVFQLGEHQILSTMMKTFTCRRKKKFANTLLFMQVIFCLFEIGKRFPLSKYITECKLRRRTKRYEIQHSKITLSCSVTSQIWTMLRLLSHWLFTYKQIVSK